MTTDNEEKPVFTLDGKPISETELAARGLEAVTPCGRSLKPPAEPIAAQSIKEKTGNVADFLHPEKEAQIAAAILKLPAAIETIKGKSTEEANLYPLEADQDTQDLLRSIVYDGQSYPSRKTTAGRYRDGRRRAACRLALGLPPCEEQDQHDSLDPIAQVLAVNENGRHLGTSERALLGAKLHRLANERYKTNPDSYPFRTVPRFEALAKTLRVSERLIRQADKLLGSPDAAAKVAAGEAKVSGKRAASKSKPKSDDAAPTSATPAEPAEPPEAAKRVAAVEGAIRHLDDTLEALKAIEPDALTTGQRQKIDNRIAKIIEAWDWRSAEEKAKAKRSRSAQWADAVGEALAALGECQGLQEEAADRLENMPENFQGGAVAAALEAIAEFDVENAISTVSELEGAEFPGMFG